MSFEDDLKAQETAPVPSLDVDVLLNGNAHTLRFRRMNGMDWSAESDKHPIRPGVLIDMRYGYNLRALVKAVAPKTGVLVEDDVEREIDEEQWKSLFKALDGASTQRVCDTVWALNEYGPQQEIDAAKKARRSTAK